MLYSEYLVDNPNKACFQKSQRGRGCHDFHNVLALKILFKKRLGEYSNTKTKNNEDAIP